MNANELDVSIVLIDIRRAQAPNRRNPNDDTTMAVKEIWKRFAAN